jgi:hypothetical protein
MQPLFSKFFAVSCVFVIAATWAGAAQKPRKKDRRSDPTARVKKKLEAAELPSEAMEKANKVLAEHSPKLKEAQGKVDAILTNEQKAAQRQAQKDAKTAGKKGKELRSAVDAALKLTSEQKSKLESAKKELATAQAALTRDLQGALTSEQLAKAGIKAKKKKGA